MSILGIDHIEFYGEDPAAAAARLCREYGFADAGPHDLGDQPGGRSVLLRQGAIALLLTGAGTPGHPAAGYVARHGDGVASIGFRTDSVDQAFGRAVAAGARPIAAPARAGRDGCQAVVSGFGDVTHRLVERGGCAAGPPPATRPTSMFEALDHVAVCLPAGQIDATVRLYADAFGLAHVFDERIEVNGQAMISKVVRDESGTATFTLIEPDPDRDPGQVDDFLDRHGGAGVQHLALRTGDIARAVRTLTARGVEFLTAPAGYYRALQPRLGALTIPVDVLRQVNVLADRDKWGELFQIFARSAHARGTFFMELIERRGALTFGSGNIRALYEALGQEQGSRASAASRD
jgi:4-hydroxymandelate synthase